MPRVPDCALCRMLPYGACDWHRDGAMAQLRPLQGTEARRVTLKHKLAIAEARARSARTLGRTAEAAGHDAAAQRYRERLAAP